MVFLRLYRFGGIGVLRVYPLPLTLRLLPPVCFGGIDFFSASWAARFLFASPTSISLVGWLFRSRSPRSLFAENGFRKICFDFPVLPVGHVTFNPVTWGGWPFTYIFILWRFLCTTIFFLKNRKKLSPLF